MKQVQMKTCQYNPAQQHHQLSVETLEMSLFFINLEITTNSYYKGCIKFSLDGRVVQIYMYVQLTKNCQKCPATMFPGWCMVVTMSEFR